MRLILASASLRRAELLTFAGFEFEVIPANVDETPQQGETGEIYTLRVAREKARHVAARVTGDQAMILGADTEVVADARILGKPASVENAAEMLRLLSNTYHDVLTAVVLIQSARELTSVVKTRVHFMPLSDVEIDRYVGSGEPMGKAGAYAIQGYAARFIDRIEGSWSNVVGLPIHAVHELMSAIEPDH